METTKIVKIIKTVFIGITFLTTLLVLSAVECHSQEYTPSQEYYNNYLSSELPSEVYYNNNLRAGGPPSGPGGSSEGNNDGTGTQHPTPVGNAGLPLVVAGIAYAGLLLYRKKCTKYVA